MLSSPWTAECIPTSLWYCYPPIAMPVVDPFKWGPPGGRWLCSTMHRGWLGMTDDDEHRFWWIELETFWKHYNQIQWACSFASKRAYWPRISRTTGHTVYTWKNNLYFNSVGPNRCWKTVDEFSIGTNPGMGWKRSCCKTPLRHPKTPTKWLGKWAIIPLLVTNY